MSAPRTIALLIFQLSALTLFGPVAIRSDEGLNLEDDNLPEIAIIGGGIGGTTTAYYLRKLFGNKASIDLFEAKQIGGRVSTVVVNGREYESGASIIHPRNQYMVNFTKLFGLRKREGHSEKLAIYDGKKFVFTGSKFNIATMAKMFWRYGMDVYNINSWVENILDKFERVYHHLEDGIAFSTVEGLLESMDASFVDLTKKTIREVLKEDGFSDLFIDELVTAGMRVNYAQGAEVHGFVGSVSLAGALPGLFSVHGGNRLVPERVLQASQVNYLPAEVTKVSLVRDHNNNVRYDLSFQHSDLPHGAEPMSVTKQYDVVVIAAPLHKRVSDIAFSGFPKPIRYAQEEFHRTVANFALGSANISHFGNYGMGDFPTAILCNNLDLFFNSFAQNTPVDFSSERDSMESEKGSVWKVFSSTPLSEEELSQLYEVHSKTSVVDWLAYPEYTPTETLPSFVLYDQLYYVNAIEMAASAMEMSAIGGRNIAQLAFNHWHGLFDKIDEIKDAPSHETPTSDKDEKKTEL
ncbi:prenylcysteine oxidase 1-like [Liolophura sinensis]|uniref:prenylcysteine oxidase 1-like n=1 Tax=Liolophura sinensis TaxID=3198878 RepID=UPI00315927A6